MNTITFRNEAQATLFEHELKGQISDGHWENFEGPEHRDYYNKDLCDYGDRGLCVDCEEDENPYWDHWKPWCDADVLVGKDVGRDFDAIYDRYELGDLDLLSVVGDRMVKYVRIAKIYGFHSVEDLQLLLDLNGNFRDAPKDKGKYWDKVREIHASVDEDMFKSYIDSEKLYSWKELVIDLVDMKKIIRTCKGGDTCKERVTVTAIG